VCESDGCNDFVVFARSIASFVQKREWCDWCEMKEIASFLGLFPDSRIGFFLWLDCLFLGDHQAIEKRRHKNPWMCEIGSFWSIIQKASEIHQIPAHCPIKMVFLWLSELEFVVCLRKDLRVLFLRVHILLFEREPMFAIRFREHSFFVVHT